MNDKRRGEIALLLLKARIRKEGIHLGSSYRSNVVKTAKAIGIPVDEAMDFAEELTRELFEETFPKTAPRAAP